MEDMIGRYLEHNIPDYNNSQFDSILNDDFVNQLKRINREMDEMILQNQSKDDYSVYTGKPGVIFYLLNKLLVSFHSQSKVIDQPLLSTCTNIYNGLMQQLNQTNTQESIVKHLKKRFTLLESTNGLLTIGIIINGLIIGNNNNNNAAEFNRLFKQLVEQSTYIIESNTIPYELLYGKSGYLQCLLMVKKNTSHVMTLEQSNQLNECILKVADNILANGISYSKQHSLRSPLMYEWHSSRYIGGAHGLSGILYTLISTIESFNNQNQYNNYNILTEDSKQLIKQSIDYIVSLMLESGNFPSREENTMDRLIQWCHGAPGVIPLLLRASRFYNNDQYLNIARQSSKVIFRYGFLVKGTGLCHGISGNAYSLLLLYRYTGNLQYLYQSTEFIKLALNTNIFKKLHTPDNPYSLFEGMCGLSWLMNDIIEIHKQQQQQQQDLSFIYFPTWNI